MSDTFLACIEALAATLSGRLEDAEKNLAVYELRIRRLPGERQAALLRELDGIVAALARLSVRIRGESNN
jgi:hypothetical protein